MNTHVKSRAPAGVSALSLLFLLPAMAPAQSGIAWVQPTRGVSVALDAFDNVYTVDYEQALGTGMIVTKRTALGALLWAKTHTQTSSTTWERASWITADPAGNAVACGTLMSGFSNPVEAASLVMKYDASGNLLWRRVYESSFDGSAVRKCLADAAGNIYVLGLGNGPAGRVTKVKKFASDGTALWSYFDTAGIGAPLNFKFTPDGHLLISAKSITGSMMGYTKIDLNGAAIWSLAGVNSLTAGDAAGDALGNSYLVHGEFVSGGGTVIKKISQAGLLVWQNVFGLAGFRIEVGSDNNAVVSGFPNSGTAGAAFIKVDSNGALLWANLNADGPLSLLAHAHMLLDSSNNAYLAAGTMSEMGVCKVNANGTPGWTQTISFGYAQAIALGNTSNSVYVVGGTTARLNQDGAPVLPAAPSGLTYSALTAGSVALAWTDNSSNETGFTVERCPGALLFCAGNPGAWSLQTTTGANAVSFLNGGLAPATTYSWRVKAFNALGNSPYANFISATTPGVPVPAAPSNLDGTARRVGSRAEITLTWTDNSSNETGFRLERCAGQNCTAFAAVAALPANSVLYTNAGLARRTVYRYRVVAAGSGGGVSAYSNVASVSTP